MAMVTSNAMNNMHHKLVWSGCNVVEGDSMHVFFRFSPRCIIARAAQKTHPKLKTNFIMGLVCPNQTDVGDGSGVGFADVQFILPDLLGNRPILKEITQI